MIPCVSLLLLLSAQAVPWPREGVHVVSREEVLEAMRHSQGYDLQATANGPRLNAEVLLRLAREARARKPQGPPLFIGRVEWFEAFLTRSGLTAERAPLYARLSYQHGQDTEVDYREDRVIDTVVEGARPAFAANVRIQWPEGPGRPSSYSYEDNLSSPRLKVTNRRLISYRLLDFGDMVGYDQIQGLLGRPTSGVLGVLFDIIGEASVVESRMTISPDGIQVSRARGRKGFIHVTTTVTVFPDGRTEKDLPPNRPDLVALEDRLKRPFKLVYVPLDPAR